MDSLASVRAMAFAGALGLSLLSACGDSADPMARFRDQDPGWHECPAERFDETTAFVAQQLAGRVSCADIRVPLDHDHPAQGEITVAVLRVRADPTRTDAPAILMNPGGPGVDGWSYPLMTAFYWNLEGTTEDPADVAAYRQLARTYDFVGFSPRGIGWSTRLECGHSRPPLPIANPTRRLEPENIDSTLVNSKQVADDCSANPLTPFINTDATARDMDLIRHLLNQEKLNYIGMSYGTWLGNWYASLFPQRVGRMLLTGVTDFSVPLTHQALPQDQGRQQVLDKVLIPYAARHPGRFGLPASESAIRQMIDALPDALHLATVSALIDRNLLSSANAADTAALTLRAAQLLADALREAPAIAEAGLRAFVDTAGFVPATSVPGYEDIAKGIAQELVRRHFRPEAENLDMFWSVVCNDAGTGFTPEAWTLESNLNARLYPDFGGSVRNNACLYWSKPPVARPDPRLAAAAGPILMLQGTMDPLTVLPGAMNSLYLSPNASMVLIDGEITHAPMPPYGNRCVDRPIARYLLDGTPPPRTTNCPSRPLAADTEAKPS